MGGRREPLPACCLVCVRFISIVYRNGITFPSIPTDGSSRTLKCPGRLLNALANAIVDGSEICIATVVDNTRVTIPIALASCNNDFQRLSYCVVRGFLGDSLAKFLGGACRSKPLAAFKQIFFILGMFKRGVTIVYDRTSDTIGFMDSHEGASCGAILACAPFTDLEYFVAWLASKIFGDSLYIPFECQYYTLAVVSFDGKLETRDQPLDYPVPRVSKRARTQIFPAKAPEEIWLGPITEYSKLRKMASRMVYEEQVSRLPKSVYECNNSK